MEDEVHKANQALPNENTYYSTVKTDQNESSKNKDTTRKFIAYFYVAAFFVVIAFVFIIGLIKSFNSDQYKDLLVAVSGILSGPLGFIVGYYFKTSDS